MAAERRHWCLLLRWLLRGCSSSGVFWNDDLEEWEVESSWGAMDDEVTRRMLVSCNFGWHWNPLCLWCCDLESIGVVLWLRKDESRDCFRSFRELGTIDSMYSASFFFCTGWYSLKVRNCCVRYQHCLCDVSYEQCAASLAHEVKRFLLSVYVLRYSFGLSFFSGSSHCCVNRSSAMRAVKLYAICCVVSLIAYSVTTRTKKFVSGPWGAAWSGAWLPVATPLLCFKQTHIYGRGLCINCENTQSFGQFTRKVAPERTGLVPDSRTSRCQCHSYRCMLYETRNRSVSCGCFMSVEFKFLLHHYTVLRKALQTWPRVFGRHMTSSVMMHCSFCCQLVQEIYVYTSSILIFSYSMSTLGLRWE